VHIDGFGYFGSGGLWVLVQKVLGTEHDAGNAKSALHSSGGHESSRKEIPFFVAYTFESENVFAGRRLGRHGTGDFSASVYQSQATAALALGLATVF
jgi:hypothetical protein